MRCSNEREQTIWQFDIVKKRNGRHFSCVCPVVENEFCHNIAKVVCGSTPGGWGGGYLTKFNTARLRPEVRPLALSYTILVEKVPLFYTFH